MVGTVSQNIYINYDMNKNEIRNLVIGSASYISSNRPNANGINDKGLLYYDQILNHIMIWDGANWKISQYLDDRDYVSTNNILIENIWTQTNFILTTASTISEATQSNVVTYSSITPTYINNTYYFEDLTNSLSQIIPIGYGSIYEPIVLDFYGTTISSTEYLIEGNKILFKNGFTNQTNITGYNPGYIVTGVEPPDVNFLKYIGTKGNFTFNSSLSVVELPSIFTNSNPYEVRMLPPTVDINEVSISNSILNINGIDIFEWSVTQSYGTFSQNLLIVNTSSLSYWIDERDKIRLFIV